MVASARFLGDVEGQIRQARQLIDQLLRLNPSDDDKNDIDLKMLECQALYEAENVANLPIVTHIASGVCFDKLISKIKDKIRKYTAAPPPPPKPKDEGFPWWGYVGIGVGALGLLGTAVWLLAPKPQPVAARGGKAA